MADLETRVFHVVDIHCEACEERIRAALLLFAGVRNVKADRRSRQVEVRLDPDQTAPDQVAERLDFLGFPPVTPAGEERPPLPAE